MSSGLVILTPENIIRQWIMFEAGAMARSVTQARVCPILFGITKSELNLIFANFKKQSITADLGKRTLERYLTFGGLGSSRE